MERICPSCAIAQPLIAFGSPRPGMRCAGCVVVWTLDGCAGVVGELATEAASANRDRVQGLRAENRAIRDRLIGTV